MPVQSNPMPTPRRFQRMPRSPTMPPTYLLARDHLQRAAVILQGADTRSRQLRHIIERTIGLMDDLRQEASEMPDNVYSLEAYRRERG
jgi:hypothetical protein